MNKDHPVSDSVNHPAHYTVGSMEVIDIIEKIVETKSDSFEGYLVSNIVKYLCRYEHKGKAVHDLKKSRWYLDKLIDVVATKEEKYDLPF